MLEKWVVGNWKMNSDFDSSCELLSNLKNELANSKSNANIGVCPPFLFLDRAVNSLPKNIYIGSQDTSENDNGAYTGEISATMIASVGCKVSIIGHSERREYHNETDDVLAKKVVKAQSKGLKVIFCVGESLEQRESGSHLEVVCEQIKSLIKYSSIDVLNNMVIAYEPIWAIGTGKIPSNDDVEQMHKTIHNLLEGFGVDLSVLYGGSVKPNNAQELSNIDGVDGFLIGGASLDAVGFVKIASVF
jgi:triosephosphate isomerase